MISLPSRYWLISLLFFRIASAFTTMPGNRMLHQPTTLNSLPKLIVFDLDNTLWTPELYQLRKLQRANITPRAGQDVHLMSGAMQILQDHIPYLQQQGVQFAVASRTKSVEWAHALLGQFNLLHIFSYVEIFPANKKQHFEKLHQASGFSYQDMLFFDDARDGKYGNCEPVSLQGVLAVHCPQGLNTVDIFHNAMDKYKQWDKTPGTIVEADGTMTIGFQHNDEQELSVKFGIVKMVNINKRYGFIRYKDGSNGDLFFHFKHLTNGVTNVEKGDEVSFVTTRDGKDGRIMAGNVAIHVSADKSRKEFPCFSMNQPFAALLANGYKDLETRNGTMFEKYRPGTIMLLHVGRRVYPDGNRHIQIMKDGGLDDESIRRMKTLPSGFGNGQIVAILELGRTFETTIEERNDAQFQRRVAAYGTDSGRMVTEIVRIAYLTKPIQWSGQPGVFKVRIDEDCIPKGYI